MIIRIREAARSFKNWSLYKLAQELKLPQQTVYSWANNRTQPNYENMEKICNSLGCTMSDLFIPEVKQVAQ